MWIIQRLLGSVNLNFYGVIIYFYYFYVNPNIPSQRSIPLGPQSNSTGWDKKLIDKPKVYFLFFFIFSWMLGYAYCVQCKFYHQNTKSILNEYKVIFITQLLKWKGTDIGQEWIFLVHLCQMFHAQSVSNYLRMLMLHANVCVKNIILCLKL